MGADAQLASEIELGHRVHHERYPQRREPCLPTPSCRFLFQDLDGDMAIVDLALGKVWGPRRVPATEFSVAMRIALPFRRRRIFSWDCDGQR